MKNLIIACAGGFGIEAYGEVIASNSFAQARGKEPPFHFHGFLSDVPVDLKSVGVNEKVIGTIKDWEPKENEVFFVGLSNPADKKRIISLLISRGAKFTNIISPYAIVASDLVIGTGCLITGGSRVSSGVRIGNYVNINGSMVCGGACIGDYSTATGFTVIEDASVGEGVFMGSKAVIKSGCKIGDWAQIYVGSVVMDDVANGKSVFGMPAKEI